MVIIKSILNIDIIDNNKANIISLSPLNTIIYMDGGSVYDDTELMHSIPVTIVSSNLTGTVNMYDNNSSTNATSGGNGAAIFDLGKVISISTIVYNMSQTENGTAPPTIGITISATVTLSGSADGVTYYTIDTDSVSQNLAANVISSVTATINSSKLVKNIRFIKITTSSSATYTSLTFTGNVLTVYGM